MGIRLGQRLRDERRRAGLSADELSQGLCTPAHLSLLETGRREPSDHLVEDLARRLPHRHLAPALRAEAAWDVREYADSARHAETAARLALADGDRELWLDMTILRSEGLSSEGLLGTARDVLEPLLTDAAAQYEALRVRILLAQTSRALGALSTAITHASEAVRLASRPHADPVGLAGAQRELVASLTEAGRTDEAWKLCARLESALTAGLPPQSTGEAHWAIGNAAFLMGEQERGSAHHRSASRILLPLDDMLLWAHFNLDASAARLDAGVADADTLAMIEHAEMAIAVVGGNERDQAAADLARAHWFFLDGRLHDAVGRLEEGRHHRALLGLRGAGDAAMLHATALQTLDYPAEALELFYEARENFEAAGAAAKAKRAVDAIGGLETVLPVGSR
jgi:transcriptional regulator with XRE-family HTH domain